MDIITRKEWLARPPADPPTKVPRGKRDAYMLHYTTGQELGRPDSAEWVRQLQRYHQETLKWDDIGYNYLIDSAGRIFEGRGRDVAGAHCPGWNVRAWGVAFLGNDDPGVDVPDAARRSFVQLRDSLQQYAGRQLLLKGHRDEKATACPGDELYGWLRGGLQLPAAPGRVPALPGPTGRGIPPWPLAPSFYYGPADGPFQSVSGRVPRRDGGRYVSRHPRTGRLWAPGLARFQEQLANRGWRVVADGRFGPGMAELVPTFQSNVMRPAGLKFRPGVVDAATWRAAWSVPIT